MQKKMLWGILLIAIALLLVGGGVFAYFSDTETASGNSFAAGTLNLQVGSADPCTEHMTVANMKPGDTGNVANWLCTNTGSITGDLTVACGAITNSGNTLTEPEQQAGEGVSTGDLGGQLTVAFWMDADKSGTWTSGDYYLKSDGTKVSFQMGDSGLPAGAYATLNSYDSKTWTGCQTNIAGATDLGNFRCEYNLPTATTNIVQSDSSVFTLTFTLNQH